MNTKTMEGLAGARTNINLVNTPIRTNFRRIDKAAVWEFYVFQ